jgi:hypothetical protein
LAIDGTRSFGPSSKPGLGVGSGQFLANSVVLLGHLFVFESSAWISHVVGVIGLTAIGCFSCIAAPAATLGVNAGASADCAVEPSFSSTPVHSEKLYFLGIGRNPKAEELEDWAQEQERERYRMQAMTEI